MTEMQPPSGARGMYGKKYLAAFIQFLPVHASLKQIAKNSSAKWQETPAMVNRLTFYCICLFLK